MQIENSVSTFFFYNPMFISVNKTTKLFLFKIYLKSANHEIEQFQYSSHVEFNEYSSINFFAYTDPGLYRITCSVNHKVYIGEAKNLLDRMNQHFKNLENGLSDCYQLQRD